MTAKAGNIIVNNPYGRMVLDDYLERVRELYRERASRLACLRTRRQAEAYRDEVASKAAACFGPFPRRTPLKVEITGVFEEKGYRVEKVKLESRPGFWVTASLYVPHKLKKAAPGVLGSCGHAPNGKAAGPYQFYSQELAQNGFVVLIFDPISQGERDQFYVLPSGDQLRSYCTLAHNMMGKQLDLAGDFFGNWRAWDATRALDYLESREEVDASRLSMTGNSGGGTMSLWMWAIERRLKMIGSSCFVSSFLANFENELPQDAEQYPPGLLAHGLDMADFLIARAPEPAIVIAQRYCFFDRRGGQAGADEVRRVYELLGQPRSFSFFLGDHGHGYHGDGRTAMRRFFCRHEGQRFVAKVENKPQSEQTLSVSPKGQVIPAGSESFQTVFGRELDKVIAKRKPLDVDGLRRRLARVLNLDKKIPGDPVGFRILRPVVKRGEQATARYAVNTERRIEAILHKHLPDGEKAHTLDVEKELTLYVPDLSSEVEAAGGKLAVRSRVKLPFYTVDVRGMGESLPDEAQDFHHLYGMDYMFHGIGAMLNESYTGRRVFDLLRVCVLLRQEGAKSIRLVGKGRGALLVLFAVALDDSITKVELHEAPRSLESFARSLTTDWPASYCPRGILRHLDLPDIYKAFSGKIRVASYGG